MNSIKCAECGLVNFASATECKRCHGKFHKPETIVDAAPAISEAAASSGVSSKPTENDQSGVVLSPLPEYFNVEAAPFTTPVIVFAVFLGLNILAFLIQLKLLLGFMSSSRYQLATDPGMPWFYIPSLEPIFYGELILKGVEFLAALSVMILFSRKSWAFLRWVRIYLLATAVYQVAEIVGGLHLQASFSAKNLAPKPTALSEIEQGAGFVAAAAFIMISVGFVAYFEKSETVKNIFID